jgi:hypothetical protein
MRKIAILGAIIGALVAATPAAARWVLVPTRSHRHHHQQKFVSHYCDVTQSPYIGGPQAQVCCKWHSYYADIPDGVGYWDCTFTTLPAEARASRSR